MLQPEEAAIEFVHFQYRRHIAADSIFYAALLLTPQSLVPKIIFLFEEKSLDSLLKSHSQRKADYVNRLYTLADRGAVALDKPTKSMYDLLWQPLEKELVGIKTIYYSPSGLLHRVNMEAIPITEMETLSDRVKLIKLGSTRQLVISTQLQLANNKAVLLGGIHYELDSTMRGGNWNYLPGTEREIKSIEKIVMASGFQSETKVGSQASEEFFKTIGVNNAASPRILHFATHGYFFEDAWNTPDSMRKNKSVFELSENPMLRTGLILAGGNAGWNGERSLVEGEDGVLTAYEISQMNLSNTELVVLSACETGLGDIQGNEGVYGLQRAFKIAGVKYIIMSLWQVPDKQTSMLMTTFYKKWLESEGFDKGEKKMSIPDAFHAAQKELRDLGFDPYQWAGFVLIE
jgi:CHAT domain-containing protein